MIVHADTNARNMCHKNILQPMNTNQTIFPIITYGLLGLLSIPESIEFFWISYRIGSNEKIATFKS